MAGRLIGIARHDRLKGPIETLDAVHVSRTLGVTGDVRGPVRPGRKDGRQVSVLVKERWEDAAAELGEALDWTARRANLLVEGTDLPRRAGFRLKVGEALVLEADDQCNPCSRMDAARHGLKAALTPDWRGGYLCRVIADGDIRIGDEVVMEG